MASSRLVSMLRSPFRESQRRDMNQQIRQLTTEVGLDWNTDSWRKYCSKRWKGKEPAVGQLGDLVDILQAVKRGKLKFVMTPDGIITALPFE